MFEIETVSYVAPDAATAVARSLHETGFAVLRDHPITPDRIERTYASWGAFFSSDEKHDWTREEGAAAGYFPFRSENAKDSAVKDLKEFYHVYETGPIPAALKEPTLALHRDLVAVGVTLLGWLQTQLPADVAAQLSEPLPDMMTGSAQNLLRVLHYPKMDATPEPGAVRAAAHGDINLVTCLLSGSEPGLEAQDTKGDWIRVPCDSGMMVINSGDMLDMATRGYYPSTVHRVVNPPTAENRARFSMPMFLHPRADAVLAGETTAGAFLDQRLQEIGLKS